MKRGIIFLILLVCVFSFIISAEENTTSMENTSIMTAKCYSDSDCGVSSVSKYCKESSACVEEKRPFCQNPGTVEAFCNTKIPQSGGNCNLCQYGCQNGECLSQPVSNYCTDPDGANHFVAGKTCTNTGCELDKCEGSTITEYACKENKIAVDHTYECIKGCQNGACISETTQAVATTTCTQKGNVCCKGDVCELAPTVCEEGYSALFQGCDSNCKSIVSCQKTAQEEVKEQVKCVFANAKAEQKCYLSEYNSKFFCSGVESCAMDVSGYKGQQLTWKSTCGGYVYTTVDGNNDYANFACKPEGTLAVTSTATTVTSTTTTAQATPVDIQAPSVYTMTWYSVGYWECYDGTEEKQGGETSCKPPEVWKKYAEEFCRNLCDDETGKCGVNSFGVSGECSGSTIIQQPVCGNSICESGEGEICEVKAAVCEENKTCKTSSGRCSITCPEDCQKTESVSRGKIGGTFNLGVSQEIAFDYLPSTSQELKIKFNDLFVPKCAEESTTEKIKPSATIETYDTMTGDVISGFAIESVAVSEESSINSSASSTKCLESEPYAVFQIKFSEDGKEKTEVIKLQLGEKKKIFDFLISFLDYWPESKGGLFLVSLAESENFECPENCICDLSGKTKECKVIESCEDGERLCSDGTCQEQCEVTEITTECKFGCFYQDKCLPYGLRVDKMYCSISNDMKTQLIEEETCDNNFECESNICVSGKCISSGLIEKLLDWFKNLFG